MQLLEVKNDIAKIIYNPAENHLLPSDFLLLEDSNQKLIAQIINISTTDASNNNLADVRLALSIDKNDNLSYYNGYIPSKTSSVVYINPDEIIELIKGSDECIYFGNLSNHAECFVKLSQSFIDDNLYIQSDREDKTKILIQNIISELYTKHKKVILLDFDGRYSSIVNVPKLKISESFKLPLNIEAFNTILENDINDCPIEDKAVIQSIVLELREYLKTLENKFLPFTLFKNVVDNEFMSNPISGLMLLRNKLWLYAQESIFAESKSQFDVINAILEKQNILVIDASNLEEKWYKFAIQSILNLIKKHCYFVLSLNDVPLDKKSIISIYNVPNVIPLVSTNYDSEYRQVLKSVCKNQILFKPSKYVNDDDAYCTLLNKVNSGEFVVYGESTLYLPLIIDLQAFDSSTSDEVIQNEIKKDVDNLLSSPQKIIPKDIVISDENPKSVSVENNNINKEQSIDTLDDDFNDSDLDFLDEQNQEVITLDEIRSKKNNQEVKTNDYDVFKPMSLSENTLKENNAVDDITKNDDQLDENIDLNLDVNDDSNDLVVLNNVDITKDEDLKSATITSQENTEPEVILPMGVSVQKNEEEINVNDIKIIENDNQISGTSPASIIENENENQEDEIVNIDDVINDITANNQENKIDSDNSQQTDNNSLVVELETDEEVSPPPIKENVIKKESPDIPVYETDSSSEIRISDVPFKIGDKVYHPKHGYGIIEGFANYSNKILFCQIEFENVGRRILDPRISGIEKVS